MKEANLTLWDKQHTFLTSDHIPSILLECGIGYGKTFVGAMWARINVENYPNVNGMLVARDLPQFKKAMRPELLKVFKIFGDVVDVDYTENKAEGYFYFEAQNVHIYYVGATNYDSAFRGPNIAWILADEADYYKREAWETMLGRLRVYPELLRVTSSPKGFNHIYDFFYQVDDKDTLVLNAPTWENLGLSNKYIRTLKKSYSPRLFEQEVGGKRLRLNVGAVFDEFDRTKHVAPCRHLLTDKDQLYFFTDYNISNYCGTYLFYKDGIVYAIGEEHLKFKGSRVMAQTVKSKWPNRPVIVMGDSTGNNKKDVAADKTNYQHFKDAGLLTKKFRNPPVQSRIISANSNIFHNKVVIDPSCKNLIRDLELMSWKEDGSDVDKSDITLSHASDGYTYGLWYFMPITHKNVTRIHSESR